MSERTLQDEIEVLEMCLPIYQSEGGLWFRNNHNLTDATFVDWGAARAFARAATELPKLAVENERLREQLASAKEALRKIAQEDYKSVDEQVRWNQPMMIWQSVAQTALNSLTDDLRDSGAPTASREAVQTNAAQPTASQTSAIRKDD